MGALRSKIPKKQDALAAGAPCAAAGRGRHHTTTHQPPHATSTGRGRGGARRAAGLPRPAAMPAPASPLPCARAARCALAQMRLASLTRVLVHTTVPRRRSKPYTAVRRISLPRITTHVCHPPTFASRHQRSQLASPPPLVTLGAQQGEQERLGRHCTIAD